MITLDIFLEGKDYFASYFFHKILYFKLKRNNTTLARQKLVGGLMASDIPDGPRWPHGPRRLLTAHTNIFRHFILISSSVFNILKKGNTLNGKMF